MLNKEKLHIDITPSPASNNLPLKLKNIARGNLYSNDLSPAKVDTDAFEYWYNEGKKFLKQVSFFYFQRNF